MTELPLLTDLIAAAVQYTPMTDLPFLDAWQPGSQMRDTDIVSVFNALFTLAMVIGAMLAVFMFIWGGLQMITARDSAGSVGKGKEKMSNAVIGLLMLLSTYVVLNTINPQLTQLSFLKNIDQLQGVKNKTIDPKLLNKALTERCSRRACAITPRTNGSTPTGRYCYDYYSTGIICFNTMTQCGIATLNTGAQGTCKDYKNKNNAQILARARQEKISAYCIKKRRIRRITCDTNQGYYTQQYCTENNLKCKQVTVSKTTKITGARYKIPNSNEAYTDKNVCDAIASTRGLGACIDTKRNNVVPQ